MHRPVIDPLLEKASGGALILTANARLARYLSREYDRSMAERGLSAWRTPSIMPFSSWADAFLTENLPETPLISSVRASALWEKIVSSDPLLPHDIVSSGAVARTSFDALSLVREYGITLSRDDVYFNDEARALARWISAYEAEVKRLGFIDRASLKWAASDLIKGKAPFPPEAVFAGFDELTPAALSIVSALQSRGGAVSFWPEKTEGGTGWPAGAVVRPMKSMEDEAVEAARRIRESYRPGERIGVIAPDLNAYRGIIEREFSAELDPASVIPGRESGPVFNISLGRPLRDDPLVRSAIDIISIGPGGEDLERISPLLLSPYLWTGEERLELARLDRFLKDKNRLRITLKEISERVSGVRLSGLFEAWIKAVSGGRRDYPSAWARAFGSLPKDVGWARHVRLSSREYQSLRAWNALLESLASLDDVLGRVSRNEAVSRLKTLAAGTIHQEETSDSGIEVMGTLEAGGIFFDRLWILGCHGGALPSPPSPNPFIPVHIQRRYGLPRSSHERELRFSRAVFKRLVESAPILTISYPLESEGRPLSLSPLVNGPLKVDCSRIEKSGRLKDIMFGPVEEVKEEEGVAVGEEELKRLKGGTNILKDQSQCPFRAFAAHRLNAREMPEPELGLSAAERGSLLHAAMKRFWEGVDGSESLKALIDSDGLSDYIDMVTAEVFSRVEPTPPLSARFIEMERVRLNALVKAYAGLEALRGAFKVKAVELQSELDLFGLKIAQRPDRVDTIEGGAEAIIDYKSTRAIDPNDWMSERPKDPQLLVYSMTGRYDAISFARIAPGDCRFLGVSRFDGTFPGVKSFENGKLKEKTNAADWEGLMGLWRQTVERLAREFLSGFAHIGPDAGRGRDNQCVYCPLPSLCRVTEHEDD